MTDIPALIERWQAALKVPSIIPGCAYADPALVKETIAALSLTISPLPEEIGRLAARLDRAVDIDLACCRQATAALQAQARDLAAMKKWALDSDETNDKLGAEREEQLRLIATLKARAERQSQSNIQLREWARNLEAKGDAITTEMRKIASFIEPHWIGAGAKLEADWIIRAIGQMNSEADDIRTTTIEEILSQIPGGNICDPQDIADRIRALKPE
jgi:hypothetical protein